MNKKVIKSWFFLLFILFCSFESLYHVLLLINFEQPRRRVFLQDHLLLSPSSLVFDRKEGFFLAMRYKLYFDDGEIKELQFKETEFKFKTYQEQNIIRMAFSIYSNVNNFRSLFCDPQSVLLRNQKIKKTILKVEVNFLYQPPSRKELLCKR